MKHFALVAFALVGYWLVSNPYNWPVFSQYVQVVKTEWVYSNVGPAMKETAARHLMIDKAELNKLIDLRDSVQ